MNILYVFNFPGNHGTLSAFLYFNEPIMWTSEVLFQNEICPSLSNSHLRLSILVNGQSHESVWFLYFL